MSKFSIQAKGEYIICRLVVEDKGEFEVVESAKPKQFLEVVAAGDAVDRCKVGDRIVAFTPNGVQEFKFEDLSFFVVTNDQVVGVI